jgi:large subunit ribosomal protein L15
VELCHVICIPESSIRAFGTSIHQTHPMPPRISLTRLQSSMRLCIRASKPITSVFLPIVAPQQHRCASILSDLRDVSGAYNKRIRRGRGPASGKGKTSGRGHKGQKQHGKVPAGFNGGQTSDEVVAGKRGFVNVYVILGRRATAA